MTLATIWAILGTPPSSLALGGLPSPIDLASMHGSVLPILLYPLLFQLCSRPAVFPYSLLVALCILSACDPTLSSRAFKATDTKSGVASLSLNSSLGAGETIIWQCVGCTNMRSCIPFPSPVFEKSRMQAGVHAWNPRAGEADRRTLRLAGQPVLLNQWAPVSVRWTVFEKRDPTSTSGLHIHVHILTHACTHMLHTCCTYTNKQNLPWYPIITSGSRSSVWLCNLVTWSPSEKER